MYCVAEKKRHPFIFAICIILTFYFMLYFCLSFFSACDALPPSTEGGAMQILAVIVIVIYP